MPLKIFIHGLESSNQGTKSIFFKKRYPDMIIPNFRGSLPERMDKLRGLLSGKSSISLVGSSFGGLMATLFAAESGPRVKRMVLLAPALNLLEHAPVEEKEISIPVWVYHGENDAVIPLKEVETVAKRIFTNLFFHRVEDDHFLHKTFKTIDWDGFLS
ncbi:MAG: alpha/beta fold hydrolase [Pseudomonadota bacterium]